MIYGWDAAYAPSTYEATRRWLNGWRFAGGYIGGPRALHAWDYADFHRIADVGYLWLPPYYVGRNVGPDPANPWDGRSRFTHHQGILDGIEACRLAAERGFPSPLPISQDMEYGTWQTMRSRARDYLMGFAESVNKDGRQCALYSDQETIANIGTPDIVDLTICAYYIRNAETDSPPFGRFDPSTPPPWDMWQYADHGFSNSADLLSARDGFPLAQWALAQ